MSRLALNREVTLPSVCEWVKAHLCCESALSTLKTRKVLYKYNVFTIKQMATVFFLKVSCFRPLVMHIKVVHYSFPPLVNSLMNIHSFIIQILCRIVGGWSQSQPMTLGEGRIHPRQVARSSQISHVETNNHLCSHLHLWAIPTMRRPC